MSSSSPRRPDLPPPAWAGDFSSPPYANYLAVEHAILDHLANHEQAGTQTDANWTVGAYVDGTDAGNINAYARRELADGAQALLFRLFREPTPEDLDRILADIDPGQFQIHCSLRYPGQDPAELFRDLVGTLRRKEVPLSQITGSVDFDPLYDWSEPPFPPLIRLLYFVSRWMPGFRVLQVNAAGFNNGATEADTEIALALAKGEAYLREVQELGYPAAIAARHLQFAFSLGPTPAADAAKLLVFQQLWSRVCGKLGITGHGCQVSAHTDLSLLTAEAEHNAERLRAQAYAARLGKADAVFLAPVVNPDDQPTEDSRHRALAYQRAAAATPLNPQLEAAVRALSDALSDAAWNRYTELAEQGGFVGAAAL